MRKNVTLYTQPKDSLGVQKLSTRNTYLILIRDRSIDDIKWIVAVAVITSLAPADRDIWSRTHVFSHRSAVGESVALEYHQLNQMINTHWLHVKGIECSALWRTFEEQYPEQG